MVEIEGRIAGAGIGVYVQTANGEVPAGMNTIECFEISIEAAEVSTAIDEIDDICGFSLIAPDKGEVARQATRVIGEAIVGIDGREGDWT